MLLAEPIAIEQPLTLWFDADQPSQREAYAVGFALSERLRKEQQLPDEWEALCLGFREGLEDRMRFDPEDRQAALSTWQQRAVAHYEQAREERERSHQKTSDRYLSKLQQDPSYQCLEEGICWEVLTAATTRQRIDFLDEVTLHYEGFHLDGTRFDSSRVRDLPLKAPVQTLLPGWILVLQRMSVGDRWRIYLPASWAFGPQGLLPYVEPYEMVFYDLEVLSVHPFQS